MYITLEQDTRHKMSGQARDRDAFCSNMLNCNMWDCSRCIGNCQKQRSQPAKIHVCQKRLKGGWGVGGAQIQAHSEGLMCHRSKGWHNVILAKHGPELGRILSSCFAFEQAEGFGCNFSSSKAGLNWICPKDEASTNHPSLQSKYFITLSYPKNSSFRAPR